MSPAAVPYVSIKVHDSGNYLIKGPQAAVAQCNLSEFLQHAAHGLRAFDGVLIPQNLGTWALGGLMSGGDIASFRADARNLWIDPIWGAPKKGKGKKKRVLRASPMPRHDVPALNPWDPDRLAAGSATSNTSSRPPTGSRLPTRTDLGRERRRPQPPTEGGRPS